jgi:hypothetical protein
MKADAHRGPQGNTQGTTKMQYSLGTLKVPYNISWPRIRGGVFDQLLFTTVRQTPRGNEDLEVLWHPAIKKRPCS